MKFEAINKTYTAPGRAINLDLGNYDDIYISNCTFKNTAGIFIQAKNNAHIVITNNNFTNIIQGPKDEVAQAIQVSGLGKNNLSQGTKVNLLISNNKIHNDPGVCDCEDVINLIGISGGVVRNNFIQGAYPKDLSPTSLKSYSGGGILCDRACFNCIIQDNEVHDTTNYGIGIAGGSDNAIMGNKVKSHNAQNVGIYIANMYKPDPFKGNYQKNNDVTWITPLKPPGRNDLWIE